MSTRPLELSDARIAAALALLKGADSVELKVSVNDTDQRSVIDLVGVWKPLEKLSFMANYDYGQESH